MAFTRADVDALKAAIAGAGNAAEVSYADGTRVRYMPIADARALLETMMQDVRPAEAAAAVLANTPGTVRAFRGSFRSGY